MNEMMFFHKLQLTPTEKNFRCLHFIIFIVMMSLFSLQNLQIFHNNTSLSCLFSAPSSDFHDKMVSFKFSVCFDSTLSANFISCLFSFYLFHINKFI